MKFCPCGSGRPPDACCLPFIGGQSSAPTAETLMRSRYTAFVMNRLDHIERTCAIEMREMFDRDEAERGSGAVKWIGLKIVGTSRGGAMDDTGTVDFSARYLANGLVNVHRENSVFRREDGAWVYVTGEIAPAAPGNRVGRNDPCPCGSGKTFKKCCGA